MKRVLLAAMLVLATPLTGCGGLQPQSTEDAGVTTSDFTFPPFWTHLDPCPTDWTWHYCFTPDGQQVKDLSYLHTDLTCGWTDPYNYACSIENTAESVGTEFTCRNCQTTAGVKWTTLRLPWFRQTILVIPTDAQVQSNPTGYNAYGAYANGSGYWDFIREDYVFTGSASSGDVVYTWTDYGKRMSGGVITSFVVDHQYTGHWTVSGTVLSVTLYNSNGTVNSTQSYTYLIDPLHNQELNLTNYPPDGTPTRYFLETGS